MITLLFGTNEVGRTKKREVIEKASQVGGAEIITFTFTTFKKEELVTLLSTRGLFGETYCVILKEVLGLDDAISFLTEEGAALKESATHFIFDSTEVSKEVQKIFSKLKANTEEFDGAATKKKVERFNVFSLTDAFNQRDKKSLWVLYSEALRAGIAPEEIGGVLHWNIKNLALYFGSGGKTAAATGLNPFVFSKVAIAAKSFTHDEVKTRAKELAELTHRSREGFGDAATLLELFVLKSF